MNGQWLQTGEANNFRVPFIRKISLFSHFYVYIKEWKDMRRRKKDKSHIRRNARIRPTVIRISAL